MADQDTDNADKTEDATPERRDDFRERGQIAVSRELTQVLVLAAMVGFITYYTAHTVEAIEKFMVDSFRLTQIQNITKDGLLGVLSSFWIGFVRLILPIFLVISGVSIVITLLQTQFNWSWKKLTPDFNNMNPLSGIGRMFSVNAIVELFKSLAKMVAVGTVGYLILRGEWKVVPGLIALPFVSSWRYFADISNQLLWGVAGFLLVIAGGDYIFNYFSLERKMRMTKQEVKEENKQREADPHVKARIKRMAREISSRKTLERSKSATVLITNPTHYSIAIKYEVGMIAPVVVGKGVDYLALRMREMAKELQIPIVENKAVARALYDEVEEGREIPSSMYKAVSEIIRYIFQIKGIRIPQRQNAPEQQV